MLSTIYDSSMFTNEQWEKFTPTEHNTWKILFERQSSLLEQRACEEIVQGIKKLAISKDKIPKFSDLNQILQKTTNFTIVAVKGFIPEDLFFKLLSERKFPATCFIRKHDQLDYLEEPDIFHDIFGHVPLLVNPIFADFMELFGVKALEAIENGMLEFVTKLYWFTVEFGLIQSKQGLRIYGAGIASSKEESIYCLDSDIPSRIKFNELRVMKTQYHTDSIQQTYFVIESFKQLFDCIKKLNWKKVRETCISFPEIAQNIVLNTKEKI